jgi:hypothetical protein
LYSNSNITKKNKNISLLKATHTSMNYKANPKCIHITRSPLIDFKL